MPWKERSIVEERMRFVLRLKDGESMASLCREFGISRVTGYKIYERYKECGLEGLTDRARTPYRYANKLPAQLEAMIVSMRREKPTWGARKLRDRLLRKLPNDVRVPARSTIHAILDRHGLVSRQRRSRTKTEGTPLSPGLTPNALWCTDYKGEFMLGDKRYCYPLPSRTTPAVIFCSAKPWSPSRNRLRLPPLSACSENAACPRPCAPTTAFPLPHPIVSST
jgi:transposase